MNHEAPGSGERQTATPPRDQNPAGQPGYPAPGQQQKLAEIRAQEAAESDNPEAILAEFEGAETPEARKNRLGQFVEKHFAEVCPPEFRDAATGRCIRFEDQYRNLFGEPDLKLSDEDASEPELKREISNAVEVAQNHEAIAAKNEENQAEGNIRDGNRTKIAQSSKERSKLEAENPDIPTDEVGRTALLDRAKAQTAERQLAVQRADDRAERKEAQIGAEHRQEAKIDRDLSTVKELQANFDQLRAEKGTIGALQELLGPDGVKSPEMRAIVDRVLTTAEAIRNAVPGKSEIVTRLLDRAPLDLSGQNALAVFAGFMAEADKSEDLSAEEKTVLRETLSGIGSGRDATVSDMSKRLDRKIERYDENGKLIESEPAFEGEDNAMKVRDGVIVYTEGGDKIMKNTRTGQIAELDASLGGVEHTRAIMEFWEQQNSLMEAGVERAWGWPLGKSELPGIDKLESFQRYMQLLEGGARNLSPVVQRNQEQNRFARNFLIISQRGDATPFTHSQEEMEQSRAGLGLTEDLGNDQNERILEAIGNFLNAPTNSGVTGDDLYRNLQQHLYDQFPALVKPPEPSAGEQTKNA